MHGDDLIRNETDTYLGIHDLIEAGIHIGAENGTHAFTRVVGAENAEGNAEVFAAQALEGRVQAGLHAQAQTVVVREAL